MLPITIDIGNFIDDLFLDQGDVKVLSKFVLDRIADRYMYLWEKSVDEQLHSTRSLYKRSMSYQYVDDFNIIFTLSGKGEGRLALMIEQGATSFDLKDGMRRSPKAHNPGQQNWWISVPFRQATSEALAESVIFAGKLDPQVQDIAKRQTAGVSFSQLPEQLQQRLTRPAINSGGKVIPEYQHKSPIQQGVVHGKQQFHGQYHTFRRISENSEQYSWIHKGFTEHDFMGKSLNSLSSEIPSIVSNAKSEFLNHLTS